MSYTLLFGKEIIAASVLSGQVRLSRRCTLDKMPAGRGNDHDVSLITRVPALAPFRIRSFRYQWPADLLASWAFEMEGVILGWFVLVETGSVLALVEDVSGGNAFDEAHTAPWRALRDRFGDAVPLPSFSTTLEYRGQGDVSDQIALIT